MIADIYTTFERRVESHEDRAFVRTADVTYTYGEMMDRVETFAGNFAEAGLTASDRLGIFLDNDPDFVAALFGAARQGITVVCLNTSLRGDSLEHLLRSADIRTLLSTDDHLSNIAETCDEADLRSVYSLSEDTKWTALQDSDLPPPASVDERDLAAMLHTSGTTGLPKWCELSHAYFTRLGDTVADEFEINGTDSVFNPLPLYHVNPLGYYLFGGLSAGATLTMVPSFSVSRFWEQVRDFGATVLILHMAPKNMLLQQTTAEEAAGHDVRVMFPADGTFMQRFKIPKVVTGYGSTEAGGLTHFNKFTHPPDLPPGENLSQFAGYPRRDVEVQLVDEQGDRVPRGERGEIRVRPTRPGAIFDGYHNSPESTLEAFDGLWYNTGDIGYVDEDGALHFVRRKTNSVSHKGEFVNVDLVESLLESHPGVAEAFIVGETDDVVCERVKACLLADGDVDPDDVVAHVEGDLPRYMVPEFIDYIDTVPRIAGTEKVDRAALRRRDATKVWRRSGQSE